MSRDTDNISMLLHGVLDSWVPASQAPLPSLMLETFDWDWCAWSLNKMINA
eukprot:CAMPEP_0194541006 /NCGR_PEP_ID=MMETSP0253-20130528/81527_1 /TAXON_ID=2966 /ORGANISM="Noctiluca scintillans" /LENGTH=50 /DNA_ID=CAMNT_0039387449 /DNA_START=37 /DNA_END=186 /DNA_ORIENTATION=+